MVISALPDNPGALAGIKGGDKIIEVDGKLTKDMNMEEVATKIRGEIGTEVTLKLVEKDGKWGYINEAGEMVIKPQFDDAYEFVKEYIEKHKEMN